MRKRLRHSLRSGDNDAAHDVVGYDIGDSG